MFVNVFRDICIKLLFYGKAILYIIGLHWAALGFLAVAPVKTTGSGGRGSANHEGGKLIDQDRDSLF